MDEDFRPTSKTSFYLLCMMHNLDWNAFESIAEKAGVSIDVVKNMFERTAVRCVDAERVLASFSQRIGNTRTLENTSVLLLPDGDTGGTGS